MSVASRVRFGALVLALEAATRWLASHPAIARHPRFACAGALGALLLANLAAHRVPNLLGYLERVVWHRMRFSDGEAYLDPPTVSSCATGSSASPRPAGRGGCAFIPPPRRTS